MCPQYLDHLSPWIKPPPQDYRALQFSQHAVVVPNKHKNNIEDHQPPRSKADKSMKMRKNQHKHAKNYKSENTSSQNDCNAPSSKGTKLDGE